MKTTLFYAGLLFMLSNIAVAQTDCYYIFYGNPDGSDFYAHIDADIEIPLWAATPAIGSGCEDLDGNGVVDSINFMYIPLASNDSIIISRNGGEAVGPLIPCNPSFSPPDLNSPLGFTTQSMLVFIDGYPYCLLFNSNGDTVHIANFFMHTTGDSSFIGQTVCPFQGGYSPTNGGLLWGIQGGAFPIVPAETFSCLTLVDYYPGDANGSGNTNGLDVNYLVNYFAGFGPPPHTMMAGDANGDCETNGLDVVYLVSYLKGLGPPPFYGDCY